MRTVTVIDNKVVVEVDGAKVRYSLEIIRKRINSLLQDLEMWREYERLLTPVAADKCPSCNGSGRYQPNYPTASRPCLACGGTGIRR